MKSGEAGLMGIESGLFGKSGPNVHEQLVRLRARKLRTRRDGVGGEQLIGNLSVGQCFLIAVLPDQRLGPKKMGCAKSPISRRNFSLLNSNQFLGCFLAILKAPGFHICL